MTVNGTNEYTGGSITRWAHLGTCCSVANDGTILVGDYNRNSSWNNFECKIYVYKYDVDADSFNSSPIWTWEEPAGYRTNYTEQVHTGSITSDGNYIAFAAEGQDNPENSTNNYGWIRVYKKNNASGTDWVRVGGPSGGDSDLFGGTLWGSTVNGGNVFMGQTFVTID